MLILLAAGYIKSP